MATAQSISKSPIVVNHLPDEGVFVCECHYMDRDTAKGAGFRWDSDKKRWWTGSADVARRLSEYATDSARERFVVAQQIQVESVEASFAEDADIDVPCPARLAYLPFQKAAIAYAIERPAVLFGDEMGLGKTIEALGVINVLAERKRPLSVLVLCPAALKINWARETAKWLVRPTEIRVVNVVGRFSTAVGVVPEIRVLICNYDMLHKLHSFLSKQVYDVLVCDECHYLKSLKARRTRYVLGRKRGRGWEIEPLRGERRLFLSGTPILNRPVEIWPLAHTLAPDEFPDYWEFVTTFCDAYQEQFGRGRNAREVMRVNGASNLDELQLKLRRSFMIRRLKKDVLKELPPKRRQVVEIANELAVGDVAAENRAYATFEETLARCRARVDAAKAGGDESEYREAVNALRDESRVAFTMLSLVRHAVARQKVPSVVELLKAALEEEDKIVVFAHHKDVVEEIAKPFGERAAVCTGDIDPTARQVAVDRFQNDATCTLIVGTIGAMGIGYNITAASHVIFAELDWTPSKVSQAEDRLHRKGQENSVLVQHVVLTDSLDARIAKMLVEKQEVIDQSLDVGLGEIPVAEVER